MFGPEKCFVFKLKHFFCCLCCVVCKICFGEQLLSLKNVHHDELNLADVRRRLRDIWNRTIANLGYTIIYFNLTSQYYILFKSVVWKEGRWELLKCHTGFGWRIQPGSSCTGVMCAAVCTTPHPLLFVMSHLNMSNLLIVKKIKAETRNKFLQ